jgi:hypothetical protein
MFRCVGGSFHLRDLGIFVLAITSMISALASQPRPRHPDWRVHGRCGAPTALGDAMLTENVLDAVLAAGSAYSSLR